MRLKQNVYLVRRVFQFLLFILHPSSFILLLSACGGAQPTLTAAVIPEGWQTVQQGGVSLALPAAWEAITPDEIDSAGALEAAATTNPQLGSVVVAAQQAFATGQVRLLAYDLDPEHLTEVLPTTLAVGILPTEGANLTQLQAANRKQIADNPAFTDLTEQRTKVAGLPAIQFAYTLAVNDQEGVALPLHVDQYLLVRGMEQYILTFTTTTAQHLSFAPTFTQILDTVRFQS